jgi:hypothetical protein
VPNSHSAMGETSVRLTLTKSGVVQVEQLLFASATAPDFDKSVVHVRES